MFILCTCIFHLKIKIILFNLIETWDKEWMSNFVFNALIITYIYVLNVKSAKNKYRYASHNLLFIIVIIIILIVL